jgi:hypothetical protein
MAMASSLRICIHFSLWSVQARNSNPSASALSLTTSAWGGASRVKTSLTIGPVTGEEIDEIVSGLFKLDSAMVAKLKNVLVP